MEKKEKTTPAHQNHKPHTCHARWLFLAVLFLIGCGGSSGGSGSGSGSGFRLVKITNYDKSGDVTSVGTTTYNALNLPVEYSIFDPKTQKTQKLNHVYDSQGRLSREEYNKTWYFSSVPVIRRITKEYKYLDDSSEKLFESRVSDITIDDPDPSSDTKRLWNFNRSYHYDASGKMVKSVQTEVNKDFSKDSSIDSSGKIYSTTSVYNYTYSASGRLAEIKDEYTYQSPHGGPDSTRNYRTTFEYNADGQVRRQLNYNSADASADASADITHEYDTSGRRTRKNSSSGAYTIFEYENKPCAHVGSVGIDKTIFKRGYCRQ